MPRYLKVAAARWVPTRTARPRGDRRAMLTLLDEAERAASS